MSLSDMVSWDHTSLFAERPPYDAQTRWMPLYSQRWLDHFCTLADTVAKQSKDPSTKCGAVLVNDRKRVVGLGYNGFPDRIPDDPTMLANREQKLTAVVHAEVNAILNATAPVHGCDMFVTGQVCGPCMKFAIASGIRRVFYRTPRGAQANLSERWKASIDEGIELARLANVPICEVPDKRPLLVYIESPYAGDIESNTNYVRACMADSIQRGEAPFASHALYTQIGVLDDTDPAQRARGIANGFAWGRHADLTAVYADMGMSKGMELGIEDAKAAGRRIEYRSIFPAGAAAEPVNLILAELPFVPAPDGRAYTYRQETPLPGSQP